MKKSPKKILRETNFSGIWNFKWVHFYLNPEILHHDEKWDYIEYNSLIFREVTWEDNFSWLWFAWFKNDGHINFYIWEWKKNKRSWYWWIFYYDWDIYEWELVDNVREWRGWYRSDEIWISYYWDWKDDAMNWYGIYNFNNWDTYKWKWVKWKRTWFWILEYHNWDVYKWNFVDWKRIWWGIYIYKDWSKISSPTWWKNDSAEWKFLYESPKWIVEVCKFKNWEIVK